MRPTSVAMIPFLCLALGTPALAEVITPNINPKMALPVPANDNEPPAAPSASGKDNSALVEEALASCKNQITLVSNACKTTGGLGGETGKADVGEYGQRQTVAQTGAILGSLQKQAQGKSNACGQSVGTCRSACMDSMVALGRSCPDCGTAEMKPFKDVMHQCYVIAHSWKKEYDKVADGAGKGKEKTDEISSGIADNDNSPVKLPPLPASGSGGELDSGGGSPQSVGSAAASPSQPAAVDSDRARTAQEDRKNSWNNPYQNQNPFMNGAQTLGPAMLERNPSTGLTEAQLLYRALNERGQKPEAKAKAQEKPAVKETALGESRFTTYGKRESNPTRTAPANVSVSNTAVNTSPRTAAPANPSAGLPGAPSGNGAWTTASVEPDGERNPSSTPGSNNYAELNERLRMQRGESGGGSASVPRSSIPLEEYLPNGSHYRGRGPAGADLPSNGIQSQGVDIWSLISKRMRSRCLDGRLRDCR